MLIASHDFKYVLLASYVLNMYTNKTKTKTLLEPANKMICTSINNFIIENVLQKPCLEASIMTTHDSSQFEVCGSIDGKGPGKVGDVRDIKLSHALHLWECRLRLLVFNIK